jgi:PhnB protein
MAQLVSYLTFNGNCKEAMNFYKDCFGGQLQLMLVGESPDTAQMPKEYHGQIMHSMLESGKINLMASDNMSPEPVAAGHNVRLCLVGESQTEIETLFAKLSEGGKVTNPLAKVFFGVYGDLTDKFGIDWMFQYGEQPTG